MANEYRKFNLTPGQQAPVHGATGVSIPGGIVWYGEEGTFPGDISSEAMTQDEIDYYGWIITQADRTEAAKNVFEGSILWDISYAQGDTYIDNNVTDMASAREFLKKLLRATVAHLKMNRLIK